MNFNTDGFNERTNYIHNSNDMNKLKQNGLINSDSSFAQMRVNERKNLVQTINQDKIITAQEVRGNKDNFIIRNNNMNRVNSKVNPNNPVSDALNKNRLR